MKNNPTLGLIGNPNSGKTTLFNRLTGAHQRVGNWPGVTVEKKQGKLKYNNQQFTIVDLPGTYNIAGDFGEESIDESIAQQFIYDGQSDILINIVDASSLERGLFLTYQLLNMQVPMVVALNMMDVAKSKGAIINAEKLAEILGCPVIPIMASNGKGIPALLDTIRVSLEKKDNAQITHENYVPELASCSMDARDVIHKDIHHLYQQVDETCRHVLHKKETIKKSFSERIDDIVLNRLLGVPFFLLAIYLLFFFAINLGSAFQDFFNITAGLIFIDIPRAGLNAIHSPDWLIAIICDGVGGGIQLIIQFVPVIAALFFALSFLEDVGYMTRAAFVVDRLMRSIGLPGKAFIPLIIGFGCNVPSVMAARTLNKEGDRLITSLMAPFMSCGARLTVYTLFVAAFFPVNGQNILFILYLIGILIAILTAFLVRRFIFSSQGSASVMEMTPYLMPTLRNLSIHTWHKLKGFVLRAGKSIVLVVVILNVLNSVGTDGTFGHQNQKNSMLSQVGKAITPIFAPIGLHKDNWPATVGIFTGMFAKEVVVGTLNALYSEIPEEKEKLHILASLKEAVLSVSTNVRAVFTEVDNPLGLPAEIDVKDVTKEQNLNKGTFSALKYFFSPLSAFSYLLFILLYMPCVATIGAIAKEHGNFWAGFSVLWSYSIAYTLAVIAFQVGSFTAHPLSSSLWVFGILCWQILLTVFVLYYGKKYAIKQRLIPVVHIH